MGRPPVRPPPDPDPSDAQRYRVGPNYPQLPIDSAKNAVVQTNQRGGQMSFGVASAPARTRT